MLGGLEWFFLIDVLVFEDKLTLIEFLLELNTFTGMFLYIFKFNLLKSSL